MQLTILAWYTEDDWPLLRKISVDRQTLPPDYSDWVAAAEKQERDMLSNGQPVKRVLVQPDALQHWAIERGMPINSQTRGHFAMDLHRRQSI